MIFGSTALKHFYPEFREPNDLDIMSTDVKTTREEQRYWIPEFKELIERSENKEFLDPCLMLAIKASHANWNIHWEKTMTDILFLKSKGLEIDRPLYDRLVKGWRKVHGREAAPLKGKTADQFFGDAVNRKYVHDDIHKAVAYYDEPIYTRIQPDNGTVECMEDLFLQMSHEDQIKMAKEEIFVTALGRWIIPEVPRYSPKRAYNAALKKFVTTMSKNWMSFFLINNFKELSCNTDDYVLLFKSNEKGCKKLWMNKNIKN